MITSNAVQETFNAIRDMQVRGAGRIARAAADALRQFATSYEAPSPRDFYQRLYDIGEYLKSARPTAVSLPNGVNFVIGQSRRAMESNKTLDEVKTITVAAAEDFVKQSLEAVQKIAEIGAKRIVDGDHILTHCNSETAVKMILKAHEMGKRLSVFVTESRPRYQGRTTASYLAKNGVPTSLIVDSAARVYMGKVDKVVVGADAMAANGAVVNKIGTAQLSVLAHEARARFFVAAESYKLSPSTFLGELVEIEERSITEVAPQAWLQANPNLRVKNPGFDVTPPEYIDIIITERGIFPPQGLILLMKELYQ